VLLTALSTSAAAQQQPPEEASIFRLVTFQVVGDYRLGATQGNGESDIVDIHNAVRALKAAGAPQVRGLDYIPADMKTLIEVGDEAVEAVKTVYRAALDLRANGRLVDTGGDRRIFYPDTAVHLRAPIPNPEQVFGMANNYEEDQTPDASTMNVVPSYFLKSAASIAGPDDEIVMTDFLEEGVETCSGFCFNSHEAEFAFVVGRRARNVSEADAMDYVFGYMVHNDVSGRSLPTGRSGTEGSSMTKGQENFAPLGPYLTLKEDVPDPYDLAIVTRLNGEVFPMPNGNTRFMRNKIPQALSMLSRVMTLEPGDIIATGVPAPTVPLRPGDTVEITIDRLGTLRNYVVAEGN
jgi:acylpyruvate hydrolase